MVAEEFDILFASSAHTVEQVIKVGLREHGGVLKLGHVVVNVIVLFNSLNNVALALKLKELLGDHDVGVVDFDHEISEVTIVLVQSSRVAVGSLVVGNGPLGSGHDTQVVVSVWVQTRHHSVLRECTLLNCHKIIDLVSVCVIRMLCMLRARPVVTYLG